jgi:hypothetical protein
LQVQAQLGVGRAEAGENNRRAVAGPAEGLPGVRRDLRFVETGQVRGIIGATEGECERLAYLPGEQERQGGGGEEQRQLQAREEELAGAERRSRRTTLPSRAHFARGADPARSPYGSLPVIPRNPLLRIVAPLSGGRH